MSSQVIDEKVVEMKFDNKDFESNVQTSLSTLKKLKEGLDLKESAESLKAVDKNVRKIDLSSLSDGVESVRMKFNALDVAAATVVSNVTSSLLHMGTKVVKEFTLDPIISGFQEYETQINAIQTILANTKNKGTTLDDVNSALDELNHYADKTIYNFTQMTKNIGTFTAAGVDLDTSVSAIKGIANLAAVSGSNAQQASTAMYQLSQALASGTVKLQDWNSVVNAGMGGEVFQEALKRTARVMGEDVDGMIEKAGSFRESLKSGWLTTQVLTETLKQFTGDMSREQLQSMGYTEQQIDDIIEMGKTANEAATKVKTFTQLIDTLKEAAQSGWTQTWELIVGDFDQAKELWTSISDNVGAAIQKSADRRNKIIKKAFGSQTEFIKDKTDLDKVLINKKDYDAYVTLLEHTAKASGVPIDDMIKKYGSFEETLKTGWLDKDLMKQVSNSLTQLRGGMTEKDLSDLHSQVEAIVKGQKTLEQAGEEGYDTDKLSEYINKIGELTDWSGKCNDALLAQADAALLLSDDQRETIKTQLMQEGITEEAADALIDYALATNHASQQTKLFSDLVDQNGKSTKSGRELLIGAAKNIASTFSSLFSSIGKGFSSIFKADWGQILYNTFEKIHDFTSKIKFSPQTLAKIQNVGSGIATVLQTIWKAITHIASAIGKLVGPVLESVGSFALSLFSDLASGLKWIANWFTKNEKIQGFLKGVNGVLSAIGSSVKTVFNKIKAPIDYFKKVYALSGKSLKTAFTATFKKYTKAIGDFFKNGDGSLKSISQIFSTIGTNIKSGLDKFFPGVVDAVMSRLKNLFQTVRDAFSLLISNPKEAFSKVGSWFIGIAKTIKEHVNELFPGLISGIKDAFVTGWTKFKDWIIKLFTNPKQWWEDTKGAFEHFFSGLGDNANDGAKGAFAVAIDKIKTTIYKAVRKIADAISLLFTDPKAFFDKVKKKLSGVWSSISRWAQEAFGGAWAAITKWFASVGTKLRDVLSKSKVGKVILKVVDKIVEIASAVGDAIRETKKNLGSGTHSFFETIKTFAKNLSDAFKSIDFGLLRYIGLVLLFVMPAIKLIKTIGSLLTVFGKFDEVVESYASKLKAEAFATKVKAIAFMIFSLTVLVAAVVGLVYLSKKSNLTISDYVPIWATVAILAAIVAALASVSVLISSKKDAFKGMQGVATIGLSIAAMAASMYIMICAMQKLIKITRNSSASEIWTAVGIMTALIIGLGVSVGLCKRISKNGDGKSVNFASILSMAVGLCLLVHSFSELINIIKQSDMSNGQLAVVTGIFLAIVVIFGIVAGIAGEKVRFGSGFGLLGMALALYTVVNVFKKILKLKVSTNAIKKNLASFIIIFGMMAAMALIARLAGKNSLKAGIGMVAMASSLLIMTNAMKSIANMDDSKLKKSTDVITKLMAYMAILVASTGFGNHTLSGAVSILALAGVIVALTGAVMYLSNVDASKLYYATDSIKTLLLSLSVLMAFLPKSKISVSSIIGIAVIVSALGAVLVIITKSDSDSQKAISASAALSLALISISKLLVGISKMAKLANNGNGWKALGISLVAIGAVLAIFAGLMEWCYSVDSNGKISVLQKIGYEVGTFIAGIKNGISENTKNISSTGGSLETFGEKIKGFMNGLVEADNNGGLDAITKLASALRALTLPALVEAVTSAFGKDGSGAYQSLGKALPDLGDGIADYVDAIKDVNFDSDSIDESVSALEKIAGISESLKQLKVVLGAGGFGGGDTKNPLKKLIKGFGFGASIETTGFDEFGKNLQAIATGVGSYCKALRDNPVKPSDLLASGLLLMMLGSIAKVYPTAKLMIGGGGGVGSIGKEGGIGAKIVGGGGSISTESSQFSKFGDVLSSIAGGIGAYCAALRANPVKISDLLASGMLLKMIGSIATAYPTIERTFGIGGGAVSAGPLFGIGGGASYSSTSSQFGSFGDALASIAEGMSKYCEKLSSGNFNFGNLIKSAFLMKMLAQVSKDIGVVTEIDGIVGGVSPLGVAIGGFSQTTGIGYTQFGDGLCSIAEGISKYCDKVKDVKISLGTFAKSALIFKVLADISNQIPDATKFKAFFGLISVDIGTGYESFGDGMETIADGMKTYCSIVNDIDVDKSKLSSISDAIDSLANLGGNSNLSAYIDGGLVDKFTLKLSQLGANIKSYADCVVDVDAEHLDTISSSLSKLAFSLSTLSTFDETKITKLQTAMDGLGNLDYGGLEKAASGVSKNISGGFANSGTEISDSATKMMKSARSAVEGTAKDFRSTGTMIAEKLLHGLESRHSAIQTALSKALLTATSKIRGLYSSFKDSGEYISYGLINGINAKQGEAYRAGYELGKAAHRGEKDAVNEGSPAKELIKSGQFIAMGLVIGIKNYEDRAYKAGYGLGSASSDGTQRALDEASRRLQNGIDGTMPTIRPVIDLSNIQSDLATMNDLLNANNMFTLNPNMSAVRSNFSSAQRDASNQDVVDAVTSLNKTLGGISANNYTINGITYDDGSNVSSAIQQLVSAARLERRV